MRILLWLSQVIDEVLEFITMEKDNTLIKVYAGKVTNLSV